MATELELRRAWLALLAAELDGHAERTATLILRRDEDPDFAARVVLYAAKMFATLASAQPDGLGEELRAETGAELYRLAAEDNAPGEAMRA